MNAIKLIIWVRQICCVCLNKELQNNCCEQGNMNSSDTDTMNNCCEQGNMNSSDTDTMIVSAAQNARTHPE